MPHPAEGPHTHDLVRGRTTVGDFELTICTDGTYLLDGGAMFGVVPKPLWEKTRSRRREKSNPVRREHRDCANRPSYGSHRDGPGQ